MLLCPLTYCQRVFLIHLVQTSNYFVAAFKMQKKELGGRIMNVNNNTKKMVTIAMLMAVSVVLVAFIHFPIMPAAPFLEYDPADIPIFIGTFLFGKAGKCDNCISVTYKDRIIAGAVESFGVLVGKAGEFAYG